MDYRYLPVAPAGPYSRLAASGAEWRLQRYPLRLIAAPRRRVRESKLKGGAFCGSCPRAGPFRHSAAVQWASAQSSGPLCSGHFKFTCNGAPARDGVTVLPSRL